MDLGGQAADAGSSSGDGLGDVLSSAFDSAQDSGAEAGSPEGQGAELDLVPGEPEQAQGQDPVDPAAPAGNEPFPLSPDGQNYQVPKAALPQLLEAQKFQAEVGKFFLSPQEAEQASYQAHDMRVMQNDWVTGSPQSIQGVLAHLAGVNHSGNPQVQARFQQAFAQAIPQAVQMLSRLNPQAFQGHVQQIQAHIVQQAYQRAALSQNPEDLKAAQYLDWGATGDYKKDLSGVQQQVQETPQQLQMREFEARQDRAYQRDVQEFNQSALEGAKFKALDFKIDTLLSKVKDRYSPAALADMKLGIQRDVMSKLKSSEWFLEHQQTFGHLIGDYQQTWKSGNPGQGLKPRVDAYVNDFLSRASRNLPEIIQSRINGTKQNAKTAQPSKTSVGTKVQTPLNGKGTANGSRLSQDQWDKEFSGLFANLR